jgi:hypothetical protein
MSANARRLGERVLTPEGCLGTVVELRSHDVVVDVGGSGESVTSTAACALWRLAPVRAKAVPARSRAGARARACN